MCMGTAVPMNQGTRRMTTALGDTVVIVLRGELGPINNQICLEWINDDITVKKYCL
jgi:hypothetical protein